jgi:hypothetical protein
MNVKHVLAKTVYLIHTYPKREWFVEGYIIPALIAMGIQRQAIQVYSDTKGLGNLKAYIDSVKKLDLSFGQQIVHLQDDVIPCRNFRKYVELDYKQIYDCDIVCAFSSLYDNCSNTYKQPAENMWFSFPCNKFSYDILVNFINWIEAVGKPKYADLYNSGKNDDALFKIFVREKGYNVFNIPWSQVQHVDQYIGGSSSNIQREFWVKSKSFNDSVVIETFLKDISENVLWSDKLKNGELDFYKLKEYT